MPYNPDIPNNRKIVLLDSDETLCFSKNSNTHPAIITLRDGAFAAFGGKSLHAGPDYQITQLRTLMNVVTALHHPDTTRVEDVVGGAWTFLPNPYLLDITCAILQANDVKVQLATDRLAWPLAELMPVLMLYDKALNQSRTYLTLAELQAIQTLLNPTDVAGDTVYTQKDSRGQKSKNNLLQAITRHSFQRSGRASIDDIQIIFVDDNESLGQSFLEWKASRGAAAAVTALGQSEFIHVDPEQVAADPCRHFYYLLANTLRPDEIQATLDDPAFSARFTAEQLFEFKRRVLGSRFYGAGDTPIHYAAEMSGGYNISKRPVKSIATSPDFTSVAIGHDDKVKLHRFLADQQTVQVGLRHEKPYAMAYVPGGGRIIVAGKRVHVIDVVSTNLVETLPFPLRDHERIIAMCVDAYNSINVIIHNRPRLFGLDHQLKFVRYTYPYTQNAVVFPVPFAQHAKFDSENKLLCDVAMFQQQVGHTNREKIYTLYVWKNREQQVCIRSDFKAELALYELREIDFSLLYLIKATDYVLYDRNDDGSVKSRVVHGKYIPLVKSEGFLVAFVNEDHVLRVYKIFLNAQRTWDVELIVHYPVRQLVTAMCFTPDHKNLIFHTMVPRSKVNGTLRVLRIPETGASGEYLQMKSLDTPIGVPMEMATILDSDRKTPVVILPLQGGGVAKYAINDQHFMPHEHRE